MKNMNGTNSVFRFTSKQYLSRNGFAKVSIIFAVLLLAGGFCLTFFTGKPSSKKEEEPEEIEKIGTVSILNTTDLKDVIPKPEKDEEGNEIMPLWDFVMVEGEEDDAFAQISDKEDYILAVIEKIEKDGKTQYVTRMKIPVDSKVSKDEAVSVGDDISAEVKNAVYRSVDMTDETIAFISISPSTKSITVDDDVSMLNSIIRTILPAILGLVMYMMILLHGQTVCKEVSVEKTSKLMETMLVSVEPNALILGKTLAITVFAIGQFFLWIVSAIVGLLLGNVVGKMVYADDFTNKLHNVITYLRSFIGESALSPAAIVIGIIVFCFGIFIYFALAAIGGSFVSKPEETSSANSAFIFPLLIFWLIPYIASVSGNEDTLRICRYIPLSAPFCVPVDVITGNISILLGLLCGLGVVAVALLLIFLAARIYRGLMLHTGQKVSLKNVWQVIIGK